MNQLLCVQEVFQTRARRLKEGGKAKTLEKGNERDINQLKVEAGLVAMVTSAQQRLPATLAQRSMQ